MLRVVPEPGASSLSACSRRESSAESPLPRKVRASSSRSAWASSGLGFDISDLREIAGVGRAGQQEHDRKDAE